MGTGTCSYMFWPTARPWNGVREGASLYTIVISVITLHMLVNILLVLFISFADV